MLCQKPGKQCMQYSAKPLQCCCGDIWGFGDNSLAEKKGNGNRFIPKAFGLGSGRGYDFPFGFLYI